MNNTNKLYTNNANKNIWFTPLQQPFQNCSVFTDYKQCRKLHDADISRSVQIEESHSLRRRRFFVVVVVVDAVVGSRQIYVVFDYGIMDAG